MTNLHDSDTTEWDAGLLPIVRRRRRVFWLLLGAPLWGLAGSIPVAAGVLPGFVYAGGFAAFFFGGVLEYLVLLASVCPRCGTPLFYENLMVNPLRRKCPKCALRLNVNAEDKSG